VTDKNLGVGVEVEWVETTEEPFVPKGTTSVFAELTPIEQAQNTYYPPTYTDFYYSLAPPFISTYGKLPEFEDVQKELIINIETTRVKPWEGQIIAIGVLDPNTLEPEALNFIQATERETLEEFIAWFENTRYTTLIGYNVSFDYRFIYAVMQKYRATVPRWLDMDLHDLMQQQKQVKAEFVFGNNPTGKLEDWATYLLGAQPYAKQEKVWDWHREGNIDEIVNFNTDKLTKAYSLWVLNKVVGGTVAGTQSTGNPEPTQGTNPDTQVDEFHPELVEQLKVQCTKCMQVQSMNKTDRLKNCEVCGTAILNPTL